jgi:hypothetical protein
MATPAAGASTAAAAGALPVVDLTASQYIIVAE